VSDRRVAPATRVDARVVVPGDKSISHRALIIGALASGRSYIGGLSPAADVAATARCLRDCGAWVRDFGRGRVALDGTGPGASLHTPDGPLDCANSGTTMRLLAGALAGHDAHAMLDGDLSLQRRPMARVAEPLRAMGAVVETSPTGTAPLRVEGRRVLRSIEWTPQVPSAQVKSAILLAALSADGPTTIHEAAPTRDHTERLLRMCGVDVSSDSGGSIRLTPGEVAPFGYRVPGDISSAAFFLCLAAARPGWRVRATRIGINPTRTGILDVLRSMGAAIDVDATNDGATEPFGDIEVRGAPLHGTSIAGSLTVRCIDELPVIAVLATQAEGETQVFDAAELRAKESDRIAEVVAGLRAFGAESEATPDGFVVKGPVRLHATRIDSHGDHRLTMAWAVAAALAGEGSGDSVIEGSEAAAVSYPAFFEDLEAALSGSG
jgi:3-phosphoshikimate 1-carboxyvinyltransferase